MYPRVPSSYATQADKWKRKEGSWRSSSSPSANSMSELVLVNELCSAAGQSSFPPKEVLNTFVRVLPTLDRAYTCELLNQKLGDSLWQVIARALLVLDTAFASAQASDFLNYFHCKLDIVQNLTQHPKQTVKSRAEKVLATLNNYEPPEPTQLVSQYQAPSPVRSHYGYQEDLRSPPTSQSQQHSFFGESLLSPVRSYSARTLTTPSPAKSQRSLMSPSPAKPQRHPQAPSAFSFMSSPEPPRPPQQNTASAFDFLNSMPTTQPSAPPMNSPGFALMSSPLQQPQINGFSIENAQPTAPQPSSSFSFMNHSTPPQNPTPSFDVFAPNPLPPTAHPAKQEKPVDHIHDAFEGLDSDSDEVDADDLLSSFRPTAQPTNRRSSDPEPVDFLQLKQAGAAREVVLEIDVPAGPMGVILDKAIPEMGVIEKFVPLPSGERGYIEMHPAICPGCALVSVNFTNVEHSSLEELGPVLAAAAPYNRVLKFKKYIVGGRVMHPVLLNIPYAPTLFMESTEIDGQPTLAPVEESKPVNPPQPAHASGFTFMASPPQAPQSMSVPHHVFESPKQISSTAAESSGFNFLVSTPPAPKSPSQPLTGFNFLSQPPAPATQYGHGLGAATSSLFPTMASPSRALVVSPCHRQSQSPARPGSAFNFMTITPPRHPSAVDGIAADFSQLSVRQTSAPEHSRDESAPSAFGFLQSTTSYSSPAQYKSPLQHPQIQQQPPAQTQQRTMSAFDFISNNATTSENEQERYTPPLPRQQSAFSFIS
ncbi:hypothetical protein THRCLA_03013 [Thraustotheca clavata]|uniref:ENTH domain-containing protein n=1 Tax=Thraustotheca clavata TaxID=74557 RepID=A0A1W0A3C5_9STRA|nr:hypothetical protein THRCLA_03013 [Thraustotheca clavata]